MVWLASIHSMLCVVWRHSARISRHHRECTYRAMTIICGWLAQYTRALENTINCGGHDAAQQNVFQKKKKSSCNFKERLKLPSAGGWRGACAGIQRGYSERSCCRGGLCLSPPLPNGRGDREGSGLTLTHGSTVRTVCAGPLGSRAGFHQHRNEVVKCGGASNIDQWEINLDSHCDGILRFPGRIQVLIKRPPFFTYSCSIPPESPCSRRAASNLGLNFLLLPICSPPSLPFCSIRNPCLTAFTPRKSQPSPPCGPSLKVTPRTVTEERE